MGNFWIVPLLQSVIDMCILFKKTVCSAILINLVKNFLNEGCKFDRKTLSENCVLAVTNGESGPNTLTRMRYLGRVGLLLEVITDKCPQCGSIHKMLSDMLEVF